MNITSNEIATMPDKNIVAQSTGAMAVEELLAQVNTLQLIMRKVMREKEHYGTIPGCGDKPALLKPGAEKILMTFRLAPAYKVNERDLGDGHREYSVQVSLSSILTGAFMGEGLGSASTMETKWRYRAGQGEVTSIPVPKSYWDMRRSNAEGAAAMLKEWANREGIEGTKFGVKKDEAGVWRISTFGERVEHDNPADYYNTCLKMAKKRALVDAVLTVTAASDIFTQDIEESPELYDGKPTETYQEVQTAASADDAVTDAQRKMLWTSAKKAGFSEAMLYAALDERFGVKHLSALTKKEASETINLIKSGEMSPEGYRHLEQTEKQSQMDNLPWEAVPDAQ